jgi:hypothetical protein
MSETNEVVRNLAIQLANDEIDLLEAQQSLLIKNRAEVLLSETAAAIAPNSPLLNFYTPTKSSHTIAQEEKYLKQRITLMCEIVEHLNSSLP